MNRRDALYYIMTGLPFDGRKAQEMGLVNEAVPADQLLARTKELARILMEKIHRCCAMPNRRSSTAATCHGTSQKTISAPRTS